MLISHDLLRIDANDPYLQGWVYAYLRAPTVRDIMVSAQYGHMIKHLEISHLDDMPFVLPPDELVQEFKNKLAEIIRLRNDALDAADAAEKLFEKAFGRIEGFNLGTSGFVVTARAAFANGRRRLEAFHHNPSVGALKSHLNKVAKDWATIEHLGFDVWLPTRFKRNSSG